MVTLISRKGLSIPSHRFRSHLNTKNWPQQDEVADEIFNRDGKWLNP